MARLSTYLPPFQRFLETATKLSINSRSRYLYEVKKFAEYLKDPAIEQLTPNAILSWHSLLVEAGGAPATINQKHASVRRFLAYLDEYVELPQAAKLLRALKQMRPPEEQPGVRREAYSLTPEQVERVIKAAGQHPGTGTRDRAMIRFMLSTTCRRQEVRDIKIQDVDLKKRQATVTGKGNKTRTVIFDEECLSELKHWIEYSSDWPRKPGTDNLFISATGRNMSFVNINRIIREAGEVAGIRKNLWAHVTRHTAISNLLDHGMPLHMVAKMAGHSDPKTTLHYSHVTESSLKSAYDKATRPKEPAAS